MTETPKPPRWKRIMTEFSNWAEVVADALGWVLALIRKID